MLGSKKIILVIPVFNESHLIIETLKNAPDFLDKIIVIDDNSNDNTVEIVKAYISDGEKNIRLLEHSENKGVGGAIATGMLKILDEEWDLVVKIDGDGQMASGDIIRIVKPVVDDLCDMTKGNRFFSREAYDKMPRIRYYGNAFLSLFTKIASGYWKIADSQSGFVCLNRKAVESIEWSEMYKRYGQPNDLLVRANVANLRVMDIAVKPLYDIGEKSSMKVSKVIFTIPLLLLRLFLWRMKEKYIIRSFHPLVLFYFIGFTFSSSFILLTSRLIYYYLMTGTLYKINSLAVMFSFMSASIFILFAMWFDMEENKSLSI